MPERVPLGARSADSAAVRIAVPESPYQFKHFDRYSSDSIILSLLQSADNRRVLDVGAAHGYLAAVLRQAGIPCDRY